MSHINTFVIQGNLVSDPELKFIKDDRALVKFRIASSRVYKKKNITSFFDGEMWGKNAENFAKFLNKGRAVIIRGYLKQDTWKASDDTNRSKIILVAEDFSFADSKKRDSKDNSVLETVPTDKEMNDIPI